MGRGSTLRHRFLRPFFCLLTSRETSNSLISRKAGLRNNLGERYQEGTAAANRSAKRRTPPRRSHKIYGAIPMARLWEHQKLDPMVESGR